MIFRVTRTSVAILAALGLALTACGSGEEAGSVVESAGSAASPEATPGGDQSTIPTIVVTTNVLGDVVSEVVGDAAEVITLIPYGADPHDFQASAQEIDQLMQADALVVNGGDYEEGLLDVIDSAVVEGVPTFEALTAVSTIDYAVGDDGHDEHDADEHGDDEHGGDDGHDDDEHGDDDHSDDDDHGDEHGHHHSGEDPHFFTDPVRMADAVEGIVDFLVGTVEFGDPAAVEGSAEAYIAALNALDADVAEMVAALSDDQRVLVTNHQVFGYFADRYDFEVVGAVIPSGTTLEATSGGELDELAHLVEAEGVEAIFSDTSASDQLIQVLAAEVGDVAVVALYTESLGEPGSAGGTYLEMVRTNSERIVGALG